MTAAAAVSTPAAAHAPTRNILMPGALGVVFGDIGTSPIHAFRESLDGRRGRLGSGHRVRRAVLRVLGRVLVVALKYVVFVVRADNHGEGGTMALLSLALPVAGRLQSALLVVGLAGASLFFGDAMITPAISVLSATEGRKSRRRMSYRSRRRCWSRCSPSSAMAAAASASCSAPSWCSGSPPSPLPGWRTWPGIPASSRR